MSTKKPVEAKPRYLQRSSPLVEGGKARVMSARKVKPGPAKPREVSEIEASGYTELPARGMVAEPEPLDEDQWERHVGRHVDPSLRARQMERERVVRLLSMEERIVKAQSEARVMRRDVSREVAFLRHMQAVNRSPSVLEKRVQALERIVYLGRAA